LHAGRARRATRTAIAQGAHNSVLASITHAHTPQGDMAEPAAPPAHTPHAGRCTTWVDDEMEARGLEAPQSSCCAKDAAQAAEATRVMSILSAADPTRRATALRAGVFAQARCAFLARMCAAVAQQLRRRGTKRLAVCSTAHSRPAGPWSEPQCVCCAQPPPLSTPRRADEDEDESSDFSDDDDGEEEEGEESAALAALRAARLKQLQRDAAKRAAQQHAPEYAQARALLAAQHLQTLARTSRARGAARQLNGQRCSSSRRRRPRCRVARQVTEAELPALREAHGRLVAHFPLTGARACRVVWRAVSHGRTRARSPLP
jgi:hypothetical protein